MHLKMPDISILFIKDSIMNNTKKDFSILGPALSPSVSDKCNFVCSKEIYLFVNNSQWKSGFVKPFQYIEDDL